MKNNFKNLLAVLATTLLLASCNDKDDVLTNVQGNGNLSIEFDNSYAGNDLILGTANTVNSHGETLKVDQIKYIVSNIVLTDENGNTFTYPKSDSYFIVSEASPSSLFLELSNIPAANYTKIKFGIGVDQQQWEAGADGQGDLLTRAEAEGMLWSWSAGYKFVMFEGTYTSASATDSPFMVHTGKSGANYNYQEVTLDLPQKALVRTSITPEIHIVADLSKVLDGSNKIALSDYDMGGMGAMIMGGDVLAEITVNLTGVFSVAHVHND